MITSIRIIFVTLFVFFSSIACSASSGEFSVLKEVSGVVKVDYKSPFLWVVVEDGSDKAAIEEKIRKLADSDSDPDEAAISNRYNLHVRESRPYRDEKRMYDAITKANSAKGMRELYRQSFRAAVYELDWSEEPVKYTRNAYTSKPYLKQSTLPPEFTNWDRELVRIDQLVGVYRKKENRPSKVVCFMTFEFGELVYPVFGDDIKVGNEFVSFEKFAKVLGDNQEPIVLGAKD